MTKLEEGETELISIYKCLLCKNLYCGDEALYHLEHSHKILVEIKIKQEKVTN